MQSRLRIRGFALKAVMMFVVSSMIASQHGASLLTTITFFAFWNGLFCGTAALFRHERHLSASLTAWDEMAAFMALALLARILATILG